MGWTFIIHVRSKHENALPIVVTHGWPGSIIEQLKIIDPLTNPTQYGASASDALHVVIPSMPGYGFSGKPTGTGWGRNTRAGFSTPKASPSPWLASSPASSIKHHGAGPSGPIPNSSTIIAPKKAATSLHGSSPGFSLRKSERRSPRYADESMTHLEGSGV